VRDTNAAPLRRGNKNKPTAEKGGKKCDLKGEGEVSQLQMSETRAYGEDIREQGGDSYEVEVEGRKEKEHENFGKEGAENRPKSYSQPDSSKLGPPNTCNPK